MRCIVGNGAFVKFGLVPIILSVVALGGHGTSAAVIWDSPAIIVDEKVVTCCPPPMAQRGKETRQQPAEAQRKRELGQAKEERERAGILSGRIDDLLKALAAAQRENRVLQERAETGRRQAEAERKRLQVEAQKERRLAEAQHKLQQAQAEEDRKKAEILSRKVEGLLQVVAAAQRENRVFQEWAEPQRTRQQKQAEEQRKKAEILSGKVGSVLEVVAADVKKMLEATQEAKDSAQRERKAQQERIEAERRQAVAARERQADTALLQTTATASSGTRSIWFFVPGGLVLVIAVVWYALRSIRRHVDKVAGVLEVVAGDVKNTSEATQNMEDAARRERESQQERSEAHRKRFEEQAEEQLKKVETLSGNVDRSLKLLAADAKKILQAVQEVPAAAQREKKVQREPAEAERQQVAILSDKVDRPMEIVAVAEANSTEGSEFQGDRLVEDLAATVKEIFDEVSKRNREDDRYHAAQEAHGRDGSRRNETAVFGAPARNTEPVG